VKKRVNWKQRYEDLLLRYECELQREESPGLEEYHWMKHERDAYRLAMKDFERQLDELKERYVWDTENLRRQISNRAQTKGKRSFWERLIRRSEDDG
jgi:hypothetical protein